MKIEEFNQQDFENLYAYAKPIWYNTYSGIIPIKQIDFLTNKYFSLEGINYYYSTPEEKFTSSDDKKFEVVNKVLEYVKDKGYDYIDIDGVRINFEDGWALVRCSNTGPNITARFEARSEKRLEEIKNEFEGVINEYNK